MIQTAYLCAAILFILGLKGLTSPKTARRGNQLSALAMLLALVTTLFDQQILTFEWIITGILLGGILGGILAIKVKMTDMPQFVAILNGSGGAASALVALSALFIGELTIITLQSSIAISISILIGTLTFSGSAIAFLKLQGLITQKAVTFTAQKIINTVLAISLIAATALSILNPTDVTYNYAILALAALLGILLTIPIGGADMPIVIALLNSYSGLAAAATGFVLNNTLLIIAGSLVGASGLILTSIMCKAMNRSLLNVLFGGAINKSSPLPRGDVPFHGTEGSGESGEKSESIYEGKIKKTGPDELAMLLDSSTSCVFVPGYGLAVAQAQHAVKELADELHKRQIKVSYAIHPVAGRMPGHMNVLLAEADVPYEQLIEMDIINPEFPQTDVAIIIGANDVTNPAARDDEQSPLFGMPILEVDKAKSVVVIKRSLSPGFAGIPNELFIKDNTMMLFGDAKQMVQETTISIKEL